MWGGRKTDKFQNSVRNIFDYNDYLDILPNKLPTSREAVFYQ